MITTIHRGVARVGDILQVVINEAGVLRASVEILDNTLTSVTTTATGAPFVVSRTFVTPSNGSAGAQPTIHLPNANGTTGLFAVGQFDILQILLRGGTGQDNLVNKNIRVRTFSDTNGQNQLDSQDIRVYPATGGILVAATLTPLRTLNFNAARTRYDAATRRLKIIENIRREGTFTILYYQNKQLVELDLGKLRPIVLPLESQLVPYNKGRGEQIEMNFALVKPQFAPETAFLIQSLSDLCNVPELQAIHVPDTATANDYRGVFRPTAIPEMRIRTEDFVLILTNLDVNHSMSIGFDSVNNNATSNFNSFSFRCSTTAYEVVSGLYLTSEL